MVDHSFCIRHCPNLGVKSRLKFIALFVPFGHVIKTSNFAELDGQFKIYIIAMLMVQAFLIGKSGQSIGKNY